MPRKGVSKLPIGVPVKEALTIMEVLTQINLKLGRLEEKFNHLIVNQ